MVKGKLYLIPTPLGEESQVHEYFPMFNTDIVNSIKTYIVEDAKTARKALKALGLNTPLAQISVYPLNEHTNKSNTNLSDYLAPLLRGENVGLMSDAGCPGVADPGAEIVRLAHEKNIEVVPLVGPSSILLSIMASGFNGQSFCFNGYLPKDQKERVAKLKELEKVCNKYGQTQLFIETPYRNSHLFEDIISSLSGETKVCIACNLTQSNAYIKTKRVLDWKKEKPDLHKRPAIFLIGR